MKCATEKEKSAKVWTYEELFQIFQETELMTYNKSIVKLAAEQM